MIILDAESLRESKITFTFIFVNIFCFIGFNVLLSDEIFYLLVQINYNIVENYEIWRLFSAIFLHADVMHLFSNMVALFLFGVAVENNYSKLEYLFIFFISGLIGNFFSLLLLPLYSISLGASGAIFGLVGAAFVKYASEDRSFLFLGLLYIAYFIFTSFAPGINLWAHLFGLAGGLFFGYLFNRRSRKKERY